MIEHLFRVTAPHFVAGFVVDEFGRVVRSAPILARFRGKLIGEAAAECMKRGWAVEYLREKDEREKAAPMHPLR